MQNVCKNQNLQNMLNMQNMQNNMYKICNKNANKYAEYVNKYRKKCRICKVIFLYAEHLTNKNSKHVVYAKYAK
jgi:hypothetical protein